MKSAVGSVGVVLVATVTLASATAAFALNITIPRACVPPHNVYPFCNASLPMNDRVDNLISLLTLEEKPYLLVARESPLGNISRLGIPEYDWGGNCIHGVQSRCAPDGHCPTSFPDPNALGASFNQSVWKGMGSVIGIETRALWLQNVGEDHSSNLPHFGLDCWSPNIGVVRDPRWGRNLETPSEDPLVCGLYGADYTMGLQEGSDPRFLQAVVTLKHFDANSLEGPWGPDGSITRHTVDANISMFDLHTTYLPAFRRAVEEGRATGVMCSYNAVNGVPSCANDYLLTTVLRDAWHFDGYVTSDSGAVADVINSHHYTKDWPTTVATTIKAGCDIESAPWPPNHPWATGGPYIEYLPQAVKSGLLAEADLDSALRHAVGLRFRLGLFDPVEDQPYWKVPPSVVRSEAHVDLAIDATRQGLVLLENQGAGSSGLPFSCPKSIAVVGPHANARGALLGNYIGEECVDGTFNCVQSPYEAISAAVSAWGGTASNNTGCAVNSTDSSGIAAAVSAAKASDAVVYFGGLDGTIEREGHDRHDIGLPGLQQELLRQLYATGKPVAVVLLHGGIITLDPDIVSGAAALVSAGYPGFYASGAMADALLECTASGVSAVNRWGKTPVTWYSQAGWAAANFDMLSFDMATPPGRTYRYYTDEDAAQWKFGHGLSYTEFEMTASPASNGIAVSVANTGDRAGDEVVFAFFSPQPGTIPASEPAAKLQRQLFTFSRVGPIAPGASTKLTIEVQPEDLTLADANGVAKFFPGDYTIVLSRGGGANEVKLAMSCTSDSCTST